MNLRKNLDTTNNDASGNPQRVAGRLNRRPLRNRIEAKKNNHAAHKPRGYRILYGGDKEDRTPDLLHAISKFPENKLNQLHMYYLNSTNSPMYPMNKILLVATAIQKLTFIG